MEEAGEALGEFLPEFPARPHDADVMAGRTPLEVWNTASRLRRADDDALLFLMQSRGCYKVGKNGVAFKVGGVRFTTKLTTRTKGNLFDLRSWKVTAVTRPGGHGLGHAFLASASKNLPSILIRNPDRGCGHSPGARVFPQQHEP